MPNEAKTWSADQLKFIQWLAIPKKQRRPKTQREFARELHVDEGTLSDWKRIAGFREEVTALARTMLRDDLSDIYAALAKKAISGDVPAIKLALEVTGEYTPRQEVTGADGGAIESKTTVKLDEPTTEHLAAVARILVEAGALPTNGAGAAANTQTDEVHPADADHSTNGVPAA